MSRFIYLYILQSEPHPERFYIGRTLDLRARLRRHNAGQVRHTAKWKPWRVKTYLALSDAARATTLERYLKSASGRAFITEATLKHFHQRQRNPLGSEFRGSEGLAFARASSI